MRFVVDAQLPPALARFLSDRGHEAEHVFDLGLGNAEDSAIWQHALRVGAAILSKDEDFAIRVSIAGDGPPVVWLRVGNTGKRALLDWLTPLLPSIEAALAAGEKLVEVV